MTHEDRNRYGAFSADGWQYEITTPFTPRAWPNVLVNRAFLTEVSQVGRGPTLYGAPSINTVSPAHRAFYVRDQQTGEYWSPAGAPAGRPLLAYRCVHRPDCTLIESERAGVGVRIRVFVPVEGTLSIWTITLRNHTDERRALSLFSFVPMQVTNRRWPAEFYNWSRYEPDLGAMLVSARFVNSPPGLKYLGYVAARPRPDHTEGSEERFLGGAGRWDQPAALEAGRLADGPGLAEPLCAALQHDVALDAGNSWTVHLVVGCEETREEVARTLARLESQDAVDALFQECWLYWHNLLGSGWLTTPDEDLNLVLNIWLKRQLAVQVLGRRWTWEVNARNTIQDAVGFLPFDAERCRRELLEAFSRQDANGFIPRDWPAVAALPPPTETRHRDIPIWAAWALANYVNETGHDAFLDEVLPFRNKKKPVNILEHAVAGLRFLAEGVGQHGLSLFGEGDWCDPLERPGREGRGESVWTSLGLVFAARALGPVAARVGRSAEAEALALMANRMADAVNATAWDGAWYIRGYADDRTRFGTHGEREGCIYLNPQTWAVLAGVADAERAGLAMESVRRRLETEVGTALLAPPYRRHVERLGRLTDKVPGTAENGSVYCHAAVFHACALAAMGQGDRAMKVYRRILPTVRQQPADLSRHVPIWMPNYYVPPTCEEGGRASALYLTGSVPWSFIFIREYVFGLRPVGNGLTVRPCLPSAWRECRLVRPFRGDEYEVTVFNPLSLQTGRARLELDGRPLEGDLIPFVGDGRHHQVIVTLERNTV